MTNPHGLGLPHNDGSGREQPLGASLMGVGNKRCLFVSALLLLSIACGSAPASENAQAEESLSELGITSIRHSVMSDLPAQPKR